MAIAGGKPTESYGLYALAGALMGGGPVWHYLYVNHYPFGQVEATALPVIGALVGSALAVAGHRIGGLLEGLIFGALLYLFVDLQFDLEKLVPSFVTVAGCLALPFLVRGRRAALTVIMLGVFYLASLPRSAIAVPSRAAAQASPADLPLLVHIVLDEQWGVGGLRAEGDSATAAFLAAFYRERGFELFEAAYSRSFLTLESLPSVLSMGQLPAYHPKEVAPGYGRSLRTIPYFERLVSRGYAIRAFETSHLDFCHAAAAPVASCVTQTANSIGNIGHLRGDWLARAVQAGRYFVTITSHLYARFYPNDGSWKRSIAGGGLFAIERARRAIADDRTGNRAFWVHVLLPHGPIDVDAQCRALWNRAWRRRPATMVSLSDSSWREWLTHEGDQIRCAHLAIAEVLATVDSTVGRDHSVIIVHGDHGARLHQNEPASSLAELDLRDLNARFSTLLAIRRPGVPAALYSEPVPLQDFIWELAQNDFKGAVRGPWRHFVRDWPRDSASSDTVRSLTVQDMLWVGSRARATAMPHSRGVHP